MKTTRYLPLLLLIPALLGAGCAPAEGNQDAPPMRGDLVLQPLDLPTAENSGEPNLTVGPDGAVYASWIDRIDTTGHALRFAAYQPGTGAWSDPTTIAEGDDWFVNWADFPSLAVGPDGHLVAHWLARNGQGRYAYGARVRQSTDGGRTWQTPQWLHDDQSATEHGFVSLVPLADGAMMAAWLDGRKFATGDHSMTLQSRRIHADGTLGGEQELDGLICDCCPSTAVALTDGGVLVAYRNRTEAEIRDIYTVRFEGGTWQAPQPVHDDGWMIAGCPVNGPALDAAGDRVVLAWFTAAADTARVQVAFSNDGGRTFDAPMRVDLGRPTGRVDAVLLADGSALVSWVEGAGAATAEGGGIMARHVAPDRAQRAPFMLQPTTTARASGYPRMVRSGDELVFAWTEVGPPRQVRTAFARWE